VGTPFPKKRQKIPNATPQGAQKRKEIERNPNPPPILAPTPPPPAPPTPLPPPSLSYFLCSRCLSSSHTDTLALWEIWPALESRLLTCSLLLYSFCFVTCSSSFPFHPVAQEVEKEERGVEGGDWPSRRPLFQMVISCRFSFWRGFRPLPVPLLYHFVCLSHTLLCILMNFLHPPIDSNFCIQPTPPPLSSSPALLASAPLRWVAAPTDSRPLLFACLLWTHLRCWLAFQGVVIGTIGWEKGCRRKSSHSLRGKSLTVRSL